MAEGLTQQDLERLVRALPQQASFIGGVSGDGAYEAGDLASAAAHFKAAAEAAGASDPGNREPVGWWYERLGRVELLRGQFIEAITAAQQSVNVRREIVADDDALDHQWRLAVALQLLGDVFAEQGFFAQADAHHGEALALAQACNPHIPGHGNRRAKALHWDAIRSRYASLLRRLGESRRREGAHGEAKALWKQALAVQGEPGETASHRIEQLALLICVAESSERDPDLYGGSRLLQVCQRLVHPCLGCGSLDDRVELARALGRLGRLSERAGEPAPRLRELAAGLLGHLRGPLSPELQAARG